MHEVKYSKGNFIPDEPIHNVSIYLVKKIQWTTCVKEHGKKKATLVVQDFRQKHTHMHKHISI